MERHQQQLIPHTQRIEAKPIHDPLRFIDADRHERFDHNRYFRLIRRHIYLVALIPLIAVSLGAIRVSLDTRIYTARATLLVTAPTPDSIEAKDSGLVEDENVAEPDYFETQCDILKSRSLAALVVSKLGLYGADRSPAAEGQGAAGLDHKLLQQAVDTYLEALRVKPLNQASLIAVNYSSPDPTSAARIANTHAEMFIKQRLALLRQRKEDVADLLELKLVELKKRLETSELALNDYRRAHGIIPGLTSLNGKDAIVIDRLTQLSTQLTAAQVKRIELESQVALIRKGESSSLPAVVADQMIQGLERELDDLYAQDRSLSSRFTRDYPAVVTLHARIRGVKSQLGTEINRQVDSIELGYESALKDEAKLDEEVARQRALTIALNDAGVKYAMLQREVDANRDLYQSVLKAMKDARVSADSEASNVVIVDRADVPELPSAPRRALIIGASLIFGLLAGSGMALLLDYLRDPLDEPEEVARLFQLPTLAVIPRLPRHKAKPAIQFSRRSIQTAKVNAEPERRRTGELAVYGPANEAYRHLRASLLLAQDVGNYVALITSALPWEGKTQTAVNTAIMLASAGKRVLLVDADLRRPRCHDYLGLDNKNGLTDLLSEGRVPNTVIQLTQTDCLYFLSSGRLSLDRSELLGSRAFSAAMDALRLMFDFIVVDSSPIVPVSDSLMIASRADGVVLVVDSNRTPKRMIRSACARLTHVRANLIGIVLNKTISDIGYYRYY